MSDFATVVAGQEVLDVHINQFAGWLNGEDPDWYAVASARADDDVNYTLTLRNLGSSGRALRILDSTGLIELLTVSDAGVVIGDTGPLYLSGPVIYDVEAYAEASDLNADGTFKLTVDASVAWNLALDAIRDADIFPAPPGGSWGVGRVLRFNSPVYLIDHTLKFIGLSSTSVTPAVPGATTNLYSGDGWSGPQSGTPSFLLGMTPAQAPMVDAVSMSNCNIWGMQLCAQTILDGDPAPTVRPAVGWLIGSTQTWSGASWGAANSDSNNNTYRNCSTIGWTKYADWAIVGSVLSTWYDCGGQSYSNEGNSMSLYVGCTVLNTTGDPDRTGTAFDSVWYPTTGSPSVSQKRLLRSASGGGVETMGTASELVFIRCEFHDMAPLAAAANPAVQSSKQRTVLIQGVNGMKLLDVPISGSGLAQIDLWNQSQNLDLEMCQNYNKGQSGARTNFFIRMMACNISNPIKGLRIHNLMGTTAPQVGWIGCENGSANDSPAFVGLHVSENNLSTAAPMFYTLSSYSGAATEVNLAYSYVDLHGCQYQFGGSIGETVTLKNIPPGGEQWSSGGGGTNKADRHFTDGTRIIYGPLTVSTGNLVATAGDVLSRHLRGNGTALSASDIVNATANWGLASANAATAIRGTDTAGAFRITAGGTGGPGANPTVVITFKSAFAAAPVAQVSVMRNSGGATAAPLYYAASTTQLAITYLGTPVNTDTHDFQFLVIGSS